MNHVNEVLELLDTIIVCGESMAKIGRLLKQFIPEVANAIPQRAEPVTAVETKETTAALPEKEVAEPEVKTYTFADVRKAFAAKSHAGHTAEVKALIVKYGAEKLSDIKETDYPALMAELEVI